MVVYVVAFAGSLVRFWNHFGSFTFYTSSNLCSYCLMSNRFEKRVRYASRKARADVRKRVKGRFVKAGDAYDYDPLNQTRSC